jgi:hypothetical protein
MEHSSPLVRKTTGKRGNQPRERIVAAIQCDRESNSRAVLCSTGFHGPGFLAGGAEQGAWPRRGRLTQAASGKKWTEFLFDLVVVHQVSAIQPVENVVNRLLGLVAVAMQKEAVEDVFTAHGIGDFGFLVVLAEFGEVHDLVTAT